MPTPLIRFEGVTFRKFQYTVFPDTCWEMHSGENWAITGANGSGKTTFLEAIEGRLIRIKGQANSFFTNDDQLAQQPVAAVYFSDHSMNYGDFYYQQRYHATETEGIITVREFLGLGNDTTLSGLEALDIEPLSHMEIIKLSNGQFKKMLIAKALLRKPRLLLLDNLYTGLDTLARNFISDTLQQIAVMGTQIVMVADNGEIPSIITHVMEVERFAVSSISTREDYMAHRPVNGECASLPELPLLPAAPVKTFDTAVRLDEVTISYNGKTILDQVDWTIHHGEKWALTGPNGAGKSMLLSLIFADNPQAYANKLTLFDRKRGTGESIWDIKDKIGFVSPEMHVYYRRGITCRDVVLSGLQENPYKQASITQDITAFMDDLFGYFSITHLADTLFQRISTGQQNIVLLIRALVKNPPMLVLDEPFQGLDVSSIERAKHLLNIYCSNRTLIFVSHHPAEIPSCVDRHLAVDKGRVSQITIEG